jgi:hypothetical protein
MIASESNNKIIQEIDQFIQKPNTVLTVEECIEGLNKIFGNPEGEDLLSANASIENKKLLVSALWRIISLNPNFTERNPVFRQRFLILLESVNSDLYKILKINPKLDGRQKLELLSPMPRKLDETFTSLITSINDFSNLTGFWHNFRKALGDPTFKLIYSPFTLSETFYKPKLDEIYKLLSDYINADGQKKKAEYEKLKRHANDIVKKIADQRTYYNESIIFAPLLERISQIISADFASSPHNQPTKLEIQKVDKKYPLSQTKKKFTIEFEIQNIGPGIAYDVNVEFEVKDELRVQKYSDFYGSLEPKKYRFTIEAEVLNKVSNISLGGNLSWKNFDEKQSNMNFRIPLEPQNSEIDWNIVQKTTPYTLEPVAKKSDLIGREDLLNELNRNAHAESPSSYFISGQKRVGKTSIVKTFSTIINNLKDKVHAIFIDGGDFAAPRPEDIVANLGVRLCQEIRKISRFKSLSTPTFTDSLTPIQAFLSQVTTIEPDIKLIFIIDEFDEFPLEMYRGDLADAFFQAIRSISGKNNFAFVLVGGEKIDVIKNYQGTKLNKFKVKSLSYFDKQTQYAEFIRLVKRPLDQLKIEINEEAIARIYSYTAGNPYFTKLICMDMYQHVYEKRDGYITENDVEESVKKTMNSLSSNSFHHFWQDGILDTISQKEDIIDKRKKVLHGLIDLHLRGVSPKESTLVSLLESDYRFSVAEASIFIKDFIRRQILVADSNGDIKCKVWLFEKWLLEEGVREIESNFSESFFRIKEQANHEHIIKSQELSQLVSSWGNYNGKRVTEDIVRAWLQQFGDVKNQRVMFSLLKHLKFYSSDTVRSKMKEAYGIIERNVIKKVQYFEPSFDSSISNLILVSYLDKISKSGAYYAKLFADENSIFHDFVIEKNKIEEKLKQNPNIKSVVFIDDFIGTGATAIESLTELLDSPSLLNFLKEKDIDIKLVSVAGFVEGKENIKNAVKYGVKLDVNICDPLNETDKVFAEKSRFFQNNSDRSIAHELSLKHGKALEEKHPLGYKDSQALVVFENSCPNNTITVIWKEKKEWMPLFRRN